MALDPHQLAGYFNGIDVFIEFFDTATQQYKFGRKIPASKLMIGRPSDQKNKLSRGKSNYGASLDTAYVPKSDEFEITFDRANAQVFSALLAGEVSDFSRAVGTIPSTAVTISNKGFIKIPYTDINPVGFTLTNTAGDVTYDEGVDYTINHALGIIEVVEGGAFDDGQDHACKYAGATVAVSGVKIEASKNYRKQLRISGDGSNQINGMDQRFWMPQAVVSTGEKIDFLQQEIMEFSFKGTLEQPKDGSKPFTLELIAKA